MSSSLVFTFMAPDRPGLVEEVSRTVTANGGNWLESRMSQLAGQFAGIVRVSVRDEQLRPLEEALQALGGGDFVITLQRLPGKAAPRARTTRRLSILGSDRAGIVSEVTRALAAHHINVCDMSTNITSAPMTAEALFEAMADIELPPDLQYDELHEQLDEIADQLSLDIVLELPGTDASGAGGAARS